jgi:hypothetical protein
MSWQEMYESLVSDLDVLRLVISRANLMSFGRVIAAHNRNADRVQWSGRYKSQYVHQYKT